MTWDVPTKVDCELCGQTMFKRSGRGNPRPFCINEQCQNFLPEDKRGYLKKKTDTAEEKAEEKGAKKTAAKKTAAKKPAAKKTTTKKAATKKATTTKKTKE